MKLSWAYVAGFFDGEGSISVVTRRVSSTSCVTVSFSQSSDLDGVIPPVLADISNLLIAVGIKHGVYESKKQTGRIGLLNDGREIVTRRRQWVIQIFNRAGCLVCLKAMLPYLRVKRVKAQDVIRHLTIYGAMRGRFTPERWPATHGRRVVKNAPIDWPAVA